MTSDTFPFFYLTVVTPSYKDVVFNEIFADPSPQVYLPTVEFVELYNSSPNIYDLSGWQFVNSTTAKTMPSLLLYPDSFVILCLVNDTSAFQPYGNVISFSSWTALSNGEDSLTLLDNSGAVIDVVAYDDSWYNDNAKDDGGWSLELINPITPCGATASNWSASNDTIGGTPGKENSIYNIAADVSSPDLISLTIVNDSTVQLFFNETMDSASLAAGVYTFTGGVSLDFVQLIASDLMSVTLVLTSSINIGTFYSITVNSVIDCPGNIISVNNTLPFVIGYKPLMGEVVINEIMADPFPSVSLPSKEFVELYNTTSQLMDLSGVLFDGEPIPDNSFVGSNEYVILCSINDTDEFSGFAVPGTSTIIGLESFPSLINGGELINLVDAQGSLIDEIEYSDEWYLDNSKDNGGWSLEKKNPTAVCNGATNWAAANNFIGGTPGAQNSIYDASPDQTLPTVAGVVVSGAQSITIIFNEPMDSASLTTGTYTITGGISIFSATTLGAPFDSVFLTFNNSLDTGITYTVTVSGVTDCPGNNIGTSNSIDFILAPTPAFGDVVINEIFADPSPIIELPDQEFIELFNTTNRVINLSGCEYDGANIPNGTYIAANGFIILCEEEDASLFSQYGTVLDCPLGLHLPTEGRPLN